MNTKKNKRSLKYWGKYLLLVLCAFLLMYLVKSVFTLLKYERAYREVEVGIEIEKIYKSIGDPHFEIENIYFKFDYRVDLDLRRKYKKVYVIYYKYPELFKKRLVFFIADKDKTIIFKQKEDLYNSQIVSWLIKTIHKKKYKLSSSI